jgi:hypothetical protein
MNTMLFSQLNIKTKEIRKLVSALETAGLTVTITSGKHHVKVVNPKTKKVVFFGPQSLGDRRAGKNILRDLKQVGFNEDMKL